MPKSRADLLHEVYNLYHAANEFAKALESWIETCEENEEYLEELFATDLEFMELDEKLEDAGNRIGL